MTSKGLNRRIFLCAFQRATRYLRAISGSRDSDTWSPSTREPYGAPHYLSHLPWLTGQKVVRSTTPEIFCSAQPYGAPHYLSHFPLLTGQKVVTSNLCFGFLFFSSKFFLSIFFFTKLRKKLESAEKCQKWLSSSSDVVLRALSDASVKSCKIDFLLITFDFEEQNDFRSAQST